MGTNIVYRSADGATLIAGSTEDFGLLVGQATAEVDSPSTKVCLENVGTRALGAPPFSSLLLARATVGASPGVNYVYTAADPNGTISKPWGADVDDSNLPTGAPTATLTGPYGSWGADLGEHGVVVTALTALGETPASVEKTFNVGGATDEWQYDWAEVPGATGYNIYRTDTPGTYGAYSWVAYVAGGATTSYVDDGAAPYVGAPPDDNSTGGDGPYYGTAPSAASHTTADKVVATAPDGLAVGQQWFFYLIVKVPAGTPAQDGLVMDILPTEAL